MPRIDFYLLADATTNAHLQFACRLVDKAYQQNHHIYIHAASSSEANLLDNMLWTYNDEKFLPHGLYGDKTFAAAPVLIGCDNDPLEQNDILVNLTQTTPGFFQRFKRMIEIVPAEENARQQARTRYKQYREQGFELATHNV